jgi:Zn-dependent M16 (insulinase) family peptidase
MSETLIGIASAVITGVLLLLGNRYVAKQTREVGEQQVEVEQRKVDQEAFDRFISRYEADRTRQDEELSETRSMLQDTRALLRSALKHINLLRNEMRGHKLTPPPLPETLETVPWDLLNEGDPHL